MIAGWAIFVFIVVGAILLVIGLTQDPESTSDSAQLVQPR
jgi:hypothetical protein